jgi:hypothetical protein
MTVESNRYEFRAFTRHLGQVEDRLRAAGALKDISESRETYIVSSASDDINVKLRAGLLDIKSRIGLQAGLEQWAPILKLELPLTVSALRDQVLNRLGETSLRLDRERYSLDDLIERIARPSTILVPAQVHKCRWRFVLGDSLAEFAEVSVNGAWMVTACVESVSPEAVTRAVSTLGLDAYANESYLAAIKRVVGLNPSP